MFTLKILYYINRWRGQQSPVAWSKMWVKSSFLCCYDDEDFDNDDENFDNDGNISDNDDYDNNDDRDGLIKL